MIRPATLYNISSDLTDIYSDNRRNLQVRTRFTNVRLLHRYHGLHSPNTRCDILKRFYCILVTDKDDEEYRFCVQFWINVNAFAALIRYTRFVLQDVEYETDDIMEWVQRYHDVHDTNANHPQMFPHIDLVMRYNASCYDPFHFLLDTTTNNDTYAREWIENIFLLLSIATILNPTLMISTSVCDTFMLIKTIASKT